MFSDDFSDSNLDEYQVVVNDTRATPNWRVENGKLVQDAGNDHNFLLVKDKQLVTQVIENDLIMLSPNGYGGVVVWYHDMNNWVSVFMYPLLQNIGVYSNVNGLKTVTYYSANSSYDTLYRFKVAADSNTGTITVFVDDSQKVTHTASSIYRTGLTGVSSGNSGASFDNLLITP